MSASAIATTGGTSDQMLAYIFGTYSSASAAKVTRGLAITQIITAASRLLNFLIFSLN